MCSSSRRRSSSKSTLTSEQNGNCPKTCPWLLTTIVFLIFTQACDDALQPG
jgi:hypothetical protein